MGDVWAPRQALTALPARPGWWLLQVRGRRIGYVEQVERDDAPPFRGWDARRLFVLGYADSLSQAADALWAEDRRARLRPVLP